MATHNFIGTFTARLFPVALKLWDNAISYDVYVLDCAPRSFPSGGTAVRVGHYGLARVAPESRFSTGIKSVLPVF